MTPPLPENLFEERHVPVGRMFMTTKKPAPAQGTAKGKVIVNNFTTMVPSGTKTKKTPAGTSACLDRVAFRGGKNRKPRFYADNADLRSRWTLKTHPTPPSPPNGAGSPVCGDPALDGAVWPDRSGRRTAQSLR